MQFSALGLEHILRVVDKFLIELEAQLHEKNVALSATPTRGAGWPQHGFDPLMGARPMARVIQEKVKRAAGRRAAVRQARATADGSGIDVKDGELVVEREAEPEKLLPVVRCCSPDEREERKRRTESAAFFLVSAQATLSSCGR